MMIENKVEGENGICTNFREGYNVGIELARESRAFWGDEKGGSFLECGARYIGSSVALAFFPITHPRVQLRNISEGVKKIGKYLTRKNN